MHKPENHGSEPEKIDVSAGFEKSDVKITGILVFITALSIFVVVTAVLCYGIGKVINANMDKEDGPTSKWAKTVDIRQLGNLPNNPEMQNKVAELTQQFPTPRVQVDDGNQDVADLHAREDLLLDNYSWVDATHAKVRIPIERAMELIAQRGLPVAPAVQTAPLMTGEKAPMIQAPLTNGFARTGFEQEEAQTEAIEARQREESKNEETEPHYNRTRQGLLNMAGRRRAGIMQSTGTMRRTWRAKAVAAAGGFLFCAIASSALMAQVSSYGDKSMGTSDKAPTLLDGVGIAQHLNQQLPLNLTFTDDAGRQVALGSYFGKRPAILALVYYRCPMLCSEEMDGLASALQMVRFVPGKDFNIIVVSIDPTEGTDLAAAKKREYLKRYGHAETADGWHFMTGTQANIDALTQAVGFRYVKLVVPNSNVIQFAHASAIQIVTPEGKLAQYYMGVEYSPKDLLLGLNEASSNRIGSPVDNILTYCYHYNPETNKHSLIVARVVQLGGGLTVLLLGGFMLVMFRRDFHQDDNVGQIENGDAGNVEAGEQGTGKQGTGKKVNG